MDRQDLQKQINYCRYVSENATADDMKSFFRNIKNNLEFLQRITKYNYFWLNETENDAANKFYEENVKGRDFGAIGGGMTYTITPTSVGQIIKISTVDDNGNMIEQDITDVSSW